MKYYEDIGLAQKVKYVHQELENIDFPYHVPLEQNESGHILKQKWIDGTSVNYEKRAHQILALQALETLHNTSNKINWSREELPNYNLQQKWQRRFERFVMQQEALKSLLRDNYDIIVNEALAALNAIEQSQKYQEAITILHGDVVHHNFMVSANEVKIIDFDLATLGEASDELILWMHRVLPQTNYNLKKLMKTHPYLQTAHHKLHYLNFPNEILRESLFYLKLNERQKLSCYPFIQSIVRDWLKYKASLKSTIQTMMM
ncbi:aminoglycoside phosphotransferase family protein [Solibacillus sp. MA9]|uniref:Aminoglycoside phosphotransferase family protein n=1 Tax=Solibacillus palustris TaxID=2908203 RepID=A0ABS9UD12_9BACL|nr:phosphotransferase [Solibacillus sp. MA9]MCH7322222.1 aminoglycoside phosphotransferase family protein [Solibacillus sp. MA9]